MNDVASPAGYERATGGWCPDTVAYGPDVLLPNEATIAATPVKNSQGKVTGFKVAAGTVKTTRYNLSYCHEGPGGYTSDGHTYDRYVSDYFTGSVTSVQVNGMNVPITPAA